MITVNDIMDQMTNEKRRWEWEQKIEKLHTLGITLPEYADNQSGVEPIADGAISALLTKALGGSNSQQFRAFFMDLSSRRREQFPRV